MHVTVLTSYPSSLTHRKFPSCTQARTQEQNQTGINRLSPLKLKRMKKLASEVLATQSLSCHLSRVPRESFQVFWPDLLGKKKVSCLSYPL